MRLLLRLLGGASLAFSLVTITISPCTLTAHSSMQHERISTLSNDFTTSPDRESEVAAPSSDLRFGVLLPFNSSDPRDMFVNANMMSCKSAIRIAVEDVNKDSTLPINITLDIRSSDPLDGHFRSGSNAMFQASLLVSSNASAVIGDYHSLMTEYSATLTSALRIPQCSFASISDTLSDNRVYGTFIRSISANDMIFRQYLSYIQLMGWRRISVLFSDDSLGRSASLVIAMYAAEYGVRIISSYRLQDNQSDNDLKSHLDAVRDTGSYVNLILGNGNYLVQALTAIQKSGILGAPYVWLTMNDVNEELLAQYRHDGLPQPNWDGLIVASILEGFQKIPAYYDFEKRWKSLDPTLYPGAGTNSKSIYLELKAYTCVWLLALGYQKDIELARKRGISDAYIRSELQQGSYPRTVGNLTSEFFSTISYTGPGGYYTLDKHGNTNSTPILIYQRQENKLMPVARSEVEHNGKYSSVILGKQIWPGWPGDTVIPRDAPDWVLQNVSWKSPFGLGMAVMVLLGVSVSVSLMLFVVWKRMNPVIQYAGPMFCLVELVAIAVIFCTVVMRIGIPKDWTCVTYPLVLSFSLSLLVGTLAVRTVRQYRLHNNVLHDRESKYDRRLIVQMVVIILFCMLPSIIFVFVAHPQAQFVNDEGEEAVFCIPIREGFTEKTAIILEAVCEFPILFLTVATALLAHRTRDMYVRWDMSFGVTCSMYNLLLYQVVHISLLFLGRSYYRLQVILPNILLICAMAASIIGLFGTRIVHMIHLACQKRGVSRWWSFNSAACSACSAKESDISGDDGEGRSLPIEDQIRIDVALRQFGFISTEQNASRSRFGRSTVEGVKKINRRLNTYADMRRHHHLPPVYATAHGGPEPVAYTTCSLYCPSLQVATVSGWSPDASETQSDVGDHQESGIYPRQRYTCMNMFNKESISVPVLIERNQWYDRLVRRWRSMQVFVMSSLNVVIVADCNEDFIETCAYTEITSSTQDGHHYLYISCLRHIGLKLEFPTEETRDYWQKSLTRCDRRDNHIESVIEQGTHS